MHIDFCSFVCHTNILKLPSCEEYTQYIFHLSSYAWNIGQLQVYIDILYRDKSTSVKTAG